MRVHLTLVSETPWRLCAVPLYTYHYTIWSTKHLTLQQSFHTQLKHQEQRLLQVHRTGLLAMIIMFTSSQVAKCQYMLR